MMKKGPIVFDMTVDEGPYSGYYDTDINWNGFLCPDFPFEEAKRILNDVVTVNQADFLPGCIWGYNKKEDFFFIAYPITPDYPFNDNLWIMKGRIIIFEGAPIKVYDIGSYMWCWIKGD